MENSKSVVTKEVYSCKHKKEPRPVIPALGRLRQEDCDFEISRSDTGRSMPAT
jgi:hypothetical protein